MSPTTRPAPRDRWVLHFTHLDNLSAIVDSGGLVCDVAAQRGLTRADVGHPEIKEIRRRRAVPVGPGGQVGDYVPFYFAPRSPMMFRIACDHRDQVAGRYSDGDRPLVYLATTIGAVIDAGLEWSATDGNAATATTQFTVDLAQLDEMVDWPLMRAERWSNTPDDPDRQRRRMAEFLVHRQMPFSVIRRIAVCSEAYVDRVQEIITGQPLAGGILVRPDWYYGYERRG